MVEKISIILPCRNEKDSLRESIKQIKKTLEKNNLNGEIIVSDSSKDGSDKIAIEEDVGLIKHDKEGYGLAIKEGVNVSSGNIIIYADPDGTYDFEDIPRFIKELKKSDIVLGSRFKGKIKKHAMPLLHRLLGTPLFNILLRVFLRIKTSDSQSGFRALKKKTFLELNLKTMGMEFATEMLIKAKRLNLKIKEVPITYSERMGYSKLNTYRDGFAHLKYIILEAPLIFYFSFGFLFLFLGLYSLFFNQTLMPATIKLLFPIIGIQILFLGLFAKTYLHVKFDEKNNSLKKFYSVFNLKFAILAGLILVLIPVLSKILNVEDRFFDVLLVSAVIGLQTIFNSIMLSELSIK